MDRNLSRRTKEATPPYTRDHSNVISEPSSSEKRITSSTDHHQPSAATYSSEPSLVSSTSELEVSNFSRTSAERSDSAQKLEEQSGPDTTPPNPAIRQILEAQPLIIYSKAQNASIQAEIRKAVFGSELFEVIRRPAHALKTAGGGKTECVCSQKLTNGDSKPQFEALDLSMPSNHSLKIVDLGISSSGNGSCYSGMRRRDEKNTATDNAGARSYLNLRTGTASVKEKSPGIGASRNVALSKKRAQELVPSRILPQSEKRLEISAPSNVASVKELTRTKK